MIDLLALTDRLSNKVVLGGPLVRSQSSKDLAVVNPATRQKIACIAVCEEPEINKAINGAKIAQQSFKKISAQERGRLVQACGQILKEHKEELALLMSYESGKALRTESRVELSVIADTFSFYGGLALELKGETIPYDPQILSFTMREPVGVVAAIIPWNVPLLLMSMKVAPALVAGNTVVLKPSPEASLVVLRAAELMNQVLPPDTLNVITGDKITGSQIVAHPDIKKVSFTGSVESGREVYKNAAQKLIPVTLELGGKSPMIILEDADLKEAAESAFLGMRFSRQGQSCSASSRFFVHQRLFDDFMTELLKRLDNLVIGDPLDEKTDIGTLISERQYEKVQHYIKMAENDPALSLHFANSLPTEAHLREGLFVLPCLISGLSNNHPICQEEIFGPVAAVLPWTNFDEVIKEANDVPFGLAAGIWTRDLPKALKAVSALDAGFVQVNQYMVFRPSLPFGGFKNSGIGKEASLDAMLEHYTKVKTILINMKG